MSSDGFGPVKTTGRVDHRRRARRVVLYVVKMLTYCESAWAIDGSFHVNVLYIFTICAHECNWCGLRSVTLEFGCVGAMFSRYVVACIVHAGCRVFCVELCVDHFKRCPLLLFACVCEIRRLLCRIWHGLDMHFEIYCGIVWLVTLPFDWLRTCDAFIKTAFACPLTTVA